jgi:serine/threonine protein phosphatase 1
MRKYVVADVRGELVLLRKLIDKIGPTVDDHLVFLGSYMGPGPDSKGVIDFLLDLRTKVPNCSFLQGCYEYVFSRALESETDWQTLQLWGSMQGQHVYESYKAKDSLMVINPLEAGKVVQMKMNIPATHINFIQHDLHQWYEDDIFPFIACHSGGHPLLFGGKLEHEGQTIFSERDWWLQDGRRIPGKTVIFSHVPFPKIFRRCGKLGLDLGCGFGGKLAAFEMVSDSCTVVSHGA